MLSHHRIRAPPPPAATHELISTSMNGLIRTYSIAGTPPNQPPNLIQYVQRLRVAIFSVLRDAISEFGALKYQLFLFCIFHRATSITTITDPPVIFPTTTVAPVNTAFEITSSVGPAIRQLVTAVETFVNNGSDWVLHRILKVEVRTVRFSLSAAIRGSGLLPLSRALTGRSYFEHKLDARQAYCSIRNSTDFCFKYAIVFALITSVYEATSHHPLRLPKRSYDVKQYDSILIMMVRKDRVVVVVLSDTFAIYDPLRHGVSSSTITIPSIQWGDLDFPFHPSSLPRFETLNPSISVYAYHIGYDTSKPFDVLYLSPRKDNACFRLHLLLLSTFRGELTRGAPVDQADTRLLHWVGVHSFDRLFGKHNSNYSRYHCRNCMGSFWSREALRKHVEDSFCRDLNKCTVMFPKKGSGEEWFGSFHMAKMHQKEFIIYLDFECILIPGLIDPRKQHHVPCAFSYTVVCTRDSTLTKAPVLYRATTMQSDGKGNYRTDVGARLIQALRDERVYIFEQLDNHRFPIDMSAMQEEQYASATCCYLCGLPFDGVENVKWRADACKYAKGNVAMMNDKYRGYTMKVRDHDHWIATSNYRGAAHAWCNLQYQRGSLYMPKEDRAFFDTQPPQRTSNNDDDESDDDDEDDHYGDDDDDDDDDDNDETHRSRFIDDAAADERCETEATRALHRLSMRASRMSRDRVAMKDRDPTRPLEKKFRSNVSIPVVMHNGGRYDVHIIVSALDSSVRVPQCIMQQGEKMMSFSFENLRFIDSYNFLQLSLASLADTVRADDVDLTKCFAPLHRELIRSIAPRYAVWPTPQLLEALVRKGTYPYEYMNSFDRFNEQQLPPRASFYSRLNDSDVSEVDYEHATNVWRLFEMKTMGDFHDLYLLTDVLILQTVFERFRTFSLSSTRLDPAHFVSLPAFSLEACLKQAPPVRNVNGTVSPFAVKLFNDSDEEKDMYLFAERAIRGGMSMIRGRYARVNNPAIMKEDLKGVSVEAQASFMYDTARPRNRITYLDANNLYGHAMSQPMPVGDYAWLSPAETQQWLVDFKHDRLDLNGDIGYFAQVDAEIPHDRHDALSEYPPMPERATIPKTFLSPFTVARLERLGEKHDSKTPKLLCSFLPKLDYVCHALNLQTYVELGVVITKCHRVLRFRQSPWIRDFIARNTERRAQAKNEFEKSFFKLCNNSVFGKMMEDVRHHRQVKIATNARQLEKAVRNPLFEGVRAVNEECSIITLRNGCVLLNKPIIVGASILELSKLHMYHFFYGVMKNVFGKRVRLLMTDTDSLVMEVELRSNEPDMLEAIHMYDQRNGTSFLDEFDFSNYPTSHPYYNKANKAVLGKFKDEFESVHCVEFVGLRSKMYSCLLASGEDKKRAKGVKRCVLESRITHDHYVRCLHGDERVVSQRYEMYGIRSINDRLWTVVNTKKGLSPSDSKLYQVDDTCSLPYGHCDIMKLEEARVSAVSSSSMDVDV